MLLVDFYQLVEEHTLALCDGQSLAPVAGVGGDGYMVGPYAVRYVDPAFGFGPLRVLEPYKVALGDSLPFRRLGVELYGIRIRVVLGYLVQPRVLHCHRVCVQGRTPVERFKIVFGVLLRVCGTWPPVGQRCVRTPVNEVRDTVLLSDRLALPPGPDYPLQVYRHPDIAEGPPVDLLHPLVPLEVSVLLEVVEAFVRSEPVLHDDVQYPLEAQLFVRSELFPEIEVASVCPIDPLPHGVEVLVAQPEPFRELQDDIDHRSAFRRRRDNGLSYGPDPLAESGRMARYADGGECRRGCVAFEEACVGEYEVCCRLLELGRVDVERYDEPELLQEVLHERLRVAHGHDLVRGETDHHIRPVGYLEFLPELLVVVPRHDGRVGRYVEHVLKVEPLGRVPRLRWRIRQVGIRPVAGYEQSVLVRLDGVLEPSCSGVTEVDGRAEGDRSTGHIGRSDYVVRQDERHAVPGLVVVSLRTSEVDGCDGAIRQHLSVDGDRASDHRLLAEVLRHPPEGGCGHAADIRCVLG